MQSSDKVNPVRWRLLAMLKMRSLVHCGKGAATVEFGLGLLFEGVFVSAGRLPSGLALVAINHLEAVLVNVRACFGCNGRLSSSESAEATSAAATNRESLRFLLFFDLRLLVVVVVLGLVGDREAIVGLDTRIGGVCTGSL